jgi:hypothetical protein
VDQVERWWNGQCGRASRREVRLLRHVRWQVRVCHGDDEVGGERSWFFDDEDSARRMVHDLLDPASPEDWRQVG